MTHTPIRCLLVAGLVLTAIVGAAPAGVTAEDPDDEQPILPLASYYGQVTIEGEPAPAGTTITALVDGERRGSVTITEAGRLGSSDGPGSDLVVSGPEAAVGSTVTFLVDGERAQVTTGTATIESATPRRQQVTLAVGSAADEPSDSPSSGSDTGSSDVDYGDDEPDSSDTDVESDATPDGQQPTPAQNKNASATDGEDAEGSESKQTDDSEQSSEAGSDSESESTADTDATEAESEESAGETPGFGAVVALLVLSAVAVGLRRQTN